ncbi:MAG: hypothetical protein CVU05_16220 [Bacteroidetes bacterium HGW-Bacteroidetes-21]|nr:MAG: hypothetical protein CVU05_16220 [Bacteroidetes bacterium HGW-Bacteroidetes-21]
MLWVVLLDAVDNIPQNFDIQLSKLSANWRIIWFVKLICFYKMKNDDNLVHPLRDKHHAKKKGENQRTQFGKKSQIFGV